jgi:four helix bundle protein
VDRKGDELRRRATAFTIRILQFVKALPGDIALRTVAQQLARSGASVSANYHAAGRARSRREFVARLGIVLEEADETEHWLGVLDDGHFTGGQELAALRREARELRAIFRAALTTARINLKRDAL